MRRGIPVLKMRGSQQDRSIREFTIDSHGMHVNEPFHGVSGILSGKVAHEAGETAPERVRIK